jgi:hypothetical protein
MYEIHGKEDTVPGEPTTFKTKILERVFEKFNPINKICDNIVGFHSYSGDMSRQVIGYHYCSIINEDFRQCLINDSNKMDAKLIGVEFIISQRLFLTLPEEEKKMWHSIAYEVKRWDAYASEYPGNSGERSHEKIGQDLWKKHCSSGRSTRVINYH